MTTTSSPVTKSEFIRSLPIEMPVQEVIAKGKEAKLKLSSGLIYGVRSALRCAPGEKKKTNGHAAAVNGDARRIESLLLTVAAEIGLGKAIELLASRREELIKLMG